MEKIMKKILLSFSVLFLLAGCSSLKKNENNKEDPKLNQEATETPEFSHDPITEDSGLIYEEIMAEDFSSIAGEYINSEGEIILFDEEDIEKNLLGVYFIENGHYYLNVRTEDGFGYGIEVYGIGVEVSGFEGLTDITKIRICRGQADPMSVEEIFKKNR